MIRIFLLSSLLLFFHPLAAQQKPLPEVNTKEWVSRAALTYTQPVKRSEEGMPVGNGRMGSLVWTTPSAIRLQLNRVDVFGNNSSSDNFYERHTDYCGGVGFVDVDFLTGDVFTGKSFRQHLSCYDGLAQVEGNAVKASILAWNEQDVIAMKIEHRRTSPGLVHINLRTLRAPVSKHGDHQAISTFKVLDHKIVLVQQFKEDRYFCSSAVVIDVMGGEAKAEQVNETTLRLLVSGTQPGFSVLAASAATFNPDEDVVAAAVKKLDLARSRGVDALYQSNKVWWKNFWERSFVQLHSPDGKADLIEQNYTYYLYVMGSSSRGAYPPKFNGMLWTTGGDDRKWGNLYWGANQSCLYNALLPTNRMELMDPMFNMYSSMRASCEVAAQQQWGSKGIFIPETVAFDGMESIPDDIASEMRELYLLQKPWNERSQKFVDDAYTKMPFMSRWNWKKDDGWKDGLWHTTDKGGGPFGHVTHIFSRGAKIAYQYWLKYEYTQDKAWLEKDAYPMLKGVAEFYRNFANLKKERDGKYHIRHVNDNESIWDGHNTVEEIASMMAIFPVAIKAAEILNVDADLRKSWSEVADNLSPLPLSPDYPGASASKPVVWIRSLPPIRQGDGTHAPDPNTMPVFFDLCTLESPADIQKLGNATFDAYFGNGGLEANTSVNVLSSLPVSGSLLGRAASTERLILNQIQTSEIEVMPNRMDLREGFQATSVQRLGRAAEALHYALCQSIPPSPGKETVIHVFPAWPKAWDAQFKLLCRGGFLVSSSFQKGMIESVEVESQAGAVCRIRNPWPGKEVTLYRNNKKWKTLKDDLLVFSTEKNDRFMLVSK